MTSQNYPQIPVKKSTGAMNVYKTEGPKFGEILKVLYDDLSNSCNYLEDLEQTFIRLCRESFGLDTSFPFKNQKNYIKEPFNHAVCISINDILAHGRPLQINKEKLIEENAVVSIDCGIAIPYKSRWLNLDAAFTVKLGSYDGNWVKAPHEALREIIIQQPTDTMHIANIIKDTAESNNLKQVVSMAGHGIGYELHEAPTIHNAPGDFSPVELFEGLCFCAEPIFIKPGSNKNSSFISSTCIGSDGWEVSTVSGDPASHFETMFGVINSQIVDLTGVSSWIL